MSVMGMGVLAYCATFVALMICAAGQTVHGYLRVVHSTSRARTLTIVYESALLLHIVLMAALALSYAAGNPDGGASFLYFDIPLQPALWANVAVAFIAAYAALAGIGFDDTVDASGDVGWMPAVDAVVVLMCTPLLASLLGDSWSIVVLADAAYFVFRTAYLLLVDKRLRHRAVSSLAIAEAMKLLPEGLLYADAHGRTLVANDAMRHCLSALGLSTDFGEVDDLWKTLNGLAKGDRAVSVVETVERDQGDWVLLRVAPHEVRLFSFEGLGFEQDRSYPSARPLEDDSNLLGESKRLLGAEARIRVIAYDMTAEVEMMQALDHANADLAASQQELQKSFETVQEAAENEAMLRMRGRVHDVIGQRLSMLHRALEDEDVSDEKLEQLKPLLNGILDDLSDGVHIDPADELEATVNAFALTGVEVTVQGALPGDKATAKLFADCIREGATNAVKHAHATHVMVTCDDSSLTIEDDGTSSVETVEEGTGLGNMRRAVEAAGGTLVVDPNPFTLRISLGLVMRTGLRRQIG